MIEQFEVSALVVTTDFDWQKCHTPFIIARMIRPTGYVTHRDGRNIVHKNKYQQSISLSLFLSTKIYLSQRKYLKLSGLESEISSTDDQLASNSLKGPLPICRPSGHYHSSTLDNSCVMPFIICLSYNTILEKRTLRFPDGKRHKKLLRRSGGQFAM